jgi:hypothetical protein
MMTGMMTLIRKQSPTLGIEADRLGVEWASELVETRPSSQSCTLFCNLMFSL